MRLPCHSLRGVLSHSNCRILSFDFRLHTAQRLACDVLDKKLAYNICGEQGADQRNRIIQFMLDGNVDPIGALLDPPLYPHPRGHTAYMVESDTLSFGKQ